MTNQEKDKFICEKLGTHWHEYNSFPLGDYSNRILFLCNCQHQTEFCEMKKSNPDFTSEAGRVQLLKLMTDKDDFWYQEEQYLDLEAFMLDDDGKFRDAVYKWLGGIETKGKESTSRSPNK